MLEKLKIKGREVFEKLAIQDSKIYAPLMQLPSTTDVAVTKEEVAPFVQCEHVLVFVNGAFRPEVSTLPVDPKVMAVTLEEGMKLFGNFLGRSLQDAIEGDVKFLSAHNLAAHTTGALIYLSPGAELLSPVQILHYMKGDCHGAFPRLHLVMGKGASASLIETWGGLGSGIWQNGVFEASLDAGAHLDFSSLQRSYNFFSCRSHNFRASLKRDANLKYGSFKENTAISHEEIFIDLNGENCEASLIGGWSLKESEALKTCVEVQHKAENCRSRQLFKGVLSDRSKSLFRGKIFVEPEAQKTDAFQLNQNLLLGEECRADAEPNLEIFADDVKASHGATTGALDEETLFYMKARGISEEQGSKILVQGFLKEIFDEMGVSS